MTELQKTEFQLLKLFLAICDKYELNYYLVCGTALGAVKYSGFIPWDDDIDVALPRDDYEKFLEIADDELPEDVFLQNYRTDENVPFFYSKLRDSKTTFVEKSVKNISMNHGVYIDVFPLDGYPDSLTKQKELERKKKFYNLQLSCVFSSERTWKSKIIYFIGRSLLWHKRTKFIVRKLDSLVSEYSVNDSVLWCNHGNWQGKLEYAPRDQYGKGAEAVFEGITVRVPEKYDEYLTQKYGDWRADLPKDEQVGHHYYSICDLEKSYKEYNSVF